MVAAAAVPEAPAPFCPTLTRFGVLALAVISLLARLLSPLAVTMTATRYRPVLWCIPRTTRFFALRLSLMVSTTMMVLTRLVQHRGLRPLRVLGVSLTLPAVRLVLATVLLAVLLWPMVLAVSAVSVVMVLSGSAVRLVLLVWLVIAVAV